METINNYINCTDLNDMRKNYLLTEETKLKDNFLDSKIKSLISHKSSIETLLNLIKRFQFDCILGTSMVNDNKKTKAILLELKEKLSNNLKKKTKIFKINKRELEEKKEELNREILSIPKKKIIKLIISKKSSNYDLSILILKTKSKVLILRLRKKV